ncbi:hypothetical protein ACA910_021882 [Epithemia clementina (nom. ined.)]
MVTVEQLKNLFRLLFPAGSASQAHSWLLFFSEVPCPPPMSDSPSRQLFSFLHSAVAASLQPALIPALDGTGSASLTSSFQGFGLGGGTLVSAGGSAGFSGGHTGDTAQFATAWHTSRATVNGLLHSFVDVPAAGSFFLQSSAATASSGDAMTFTVPLNDEHTSGKVMFVLADSSVVSEVHENKSHAITGGNSVLLILICLTAPTV